MTTRAIELFGCSGGMAEGFRRAGIEFAEAFDSDADACESYARNLGHRPIRMDVRELLRLTTLAGCTPGKLELVVADPPCTPWSRAGKRRGLEDGRDMLAVTTELLQHWSPTTWLIGNVAGLDDAPNAEALQHTMGRLATGYCIDFALLDAAAYGVPQHRWRPFWFGHPTGTSCIRWPQPTHCGDDKQLQLAGTQLTPLVTVRQALAHLTRRELGTPIRIRTRSGRHGHPCSRAHRPAGTIAASMPGNGGGVLAYGTGRHHRPGHPDEPARTLTRNTHSDGALAHWPWTRKPRSDGPNAIKLSEHAAAILQGFPAGWQFAGNTKRSRWSQLGQAMPPPLAAAVAHQIAAWLHAYGQEHAA